MCFCYTRVAKGSILYILINFSFAPDLFNFFLYQCFSYFLPPQFPKALIISFNLFLSPLLRLDNLYCSMLFNQVHPVIYFFIIIIFYVRYIVFSSEIPVWFFFYSFCFSAVNSYTFPLISNIFIFIPRADYNSLF